MIYIGIVFLFNLFVYYLNNNIFWIEMKSAQREKQFKVAVGALF